MGKPDWLDNAIHHVRHGHRPEWLRIEWDGRNIWKCKRCVKGGHPVRVLRPMGVGL